MCTRITYANVNIIIVVPLMFLLQKCSKPHSCCQGYVTQLEKHVNLIVSLLDYTIWYTFKIAPKDKGLCGLFHSPLLMCHYLMSLRSRCHRRTILPAHQLISSISIVVHTMSVSAAFLISVLKLTLNVIFSKSRWKESQNHSAVLQDSCRAEILRRLCRSWTSSKPFPVFTDG